ncbi:crotonobetainyl-CoA:carnitine CoA-transferase CaiB-like acyl-CoA transferase [Trinickia symbiotica]|uniref:CoA transferase n=1 Tax=Trinickia symbiotica TaxID=863227 RepID=A0A2N7X6K9_9BURK|nr:CoA transferase [Trinickia symbiotica]PMS37383.1 CoA transferase [Trinickia symbiotica]PPK42804.1 crotonobetainyl-CoA:carnitine CoA-transferase CaiB-like acyl-CoA transferase [Trinickia symbiotica]
MTKAAKLPLEGIRVLDVTQVMAGPFACMMLADAGADVIKVEPAEGDQTRSAMGFKMKGPDSMGFLNLNRNKRSIVLDLKSDEGRETFYELAKTADAIVENYRPGVVQRLRIDYESIRKINPKIVYVSISGFGQSGPWSSRPGFDLIAQAMSGVMSVTGYKGGKPVKCGVPVADLGCALFAVYGLLSAYIGAQKTGVGQHIDASLLDSAMAFAIWEMSDYWGTGVPPAPLGTGNKMSAPYQAVKARDGYFVMGATNQKLWTRLCELLERPDLMKHPDFETVSLRLKNREAMIEILEREFARRDSADWVDALLAAGIPAGPLLSYPQAFESGHAQHRRMCMEIDHPVEGKVKNIGFPVKMLGTPQQVRRHPPRLGEHNDEIFAEIKRRAS